MQTAAHPPGTLARRQRRAILAGLAGVTLLAWLELARMTWNMHSAMQAGDRLRAPPLERADAALTFVMWAVMMVGMMVPSAAPMSLIFASVSRKAAAQGRAVAPTFAVSSRATWRPGRSSVSAPRRSSGGSSSTALLSPMLASASPLFGGALLVRRGPLPALAVEGRLPRPLPCRPRASSRRTGGRARWGAFRMGLAHGLYCLGCCWLLMGLLFFGGVMNLLWVAGLDRSSCWSRRSRRTARCVARLAGIAMLVAGRAARRSFL